MTDISREEALAHFGVKGQKWGVRNERRKTAAKNLVESKKAKYERGKQHNAEVKSARARMKDKVDKLGELEDKAYATGKKSDWDKFESADKAYSIRKDPDWQKAKKMTVGEKVATGVLVGAGALAAAAILKGIGSKPPSALLTWEPEHVSVMMDTIPYTVKVPKV